MADCPVCELHAESVFKIEGMDCHEEVAILEHRLKTLAGLEALDADVVGQRLRIQYDAAKLTTSRIAEAVAQTGMRAWLEHEEPRPASASLWRERLVLLAGAFLALGLALQLWGAAPVAWVLPYVAAVILSGTQTARRAWTSLIAGRLDIHVLMMVAVAGAIALGEWAEGASVVFLFALAQVLESRAMERARGAIRALMDLAPAEALVRRDGTERTIAIDSVTVGDIVIVRPGEKIPLDGRVQAGESHVNQAPITGSPFPSTKTPGDDVFGGAINGRGVLDVAVTRLRRDSTLARIIHLVERAQAQRAPSQTFVDRFARVYTPIVLALAVAIAVLPPLLLGGQWSDWVYRSLVLLVISCPCALVISTPVSIVSALAAAARKGVLIKGGARLERLAAVKCVAFDKTGTLTRARLRVTDIVPVNGAQPAEILALAASLESRSEHPIGRAIVERAQADGLALSPVERVEALPGLGAQGQLAARAVVAGSHRLFAQRGWSGPEVERATELLAARGDSTVVVAADGQVLGVIGVADEVRAGRRGYGGHARAARDRSRRPADRRSRAGGAGARRERRHLRLPLGTAAGTEVGGRRGFARPLRRARDGGGWGQRRAGAGRGRRGDRDGCRRHRRRARNRRRRADGRRAGEDSLRLASQPRDRPEHPRQRRLLARAQGAPSWRSR